MDTFGRIAIGTHFGCIDHQGTVVDGVYTLPANEVMSAFDYLGTVTGTRFKRPGWAVLEKLDGTEAKIRMAQNLVFDFADRMIAEKRERMKSEKEGDSPKTHKDLLDFFMHTTNFKGNPLSDEELHDVIMTFLIAGKIRG